MKGLFLTSSVKVFFKLNISLEMVLILYMQTLEVFILSSMKTEH